MLQTLSDIKYIPAYFVSLISRKKLLQQIQQIQLV